MSRSRSNASWIRARPRSRGALTLVGVIALVALAGCGSGDDAPTSADAAADAGSSAAQAGGTGMASEAGAADGAGRLSQASLAAERRQIMTAGLVVETDNVLSAARQAESIAVGAGGFVTDEDTQVERRDGTSEVAALTVSKLTVRVPPTALDEVLGRLAALGTLVSQNRSTTDVTDEYVDVEARLASQRASLDRLLQLVGSAGALDDVIALESEIARRQSDLDALAARLQSLDEETGLATISVTLASEQAAVVAKTEDGFLAGLDTGWQAFTTAVVGALTVLGALLPFAILVAVVAIPWLVLRRRRSTGQAVLADAPSAAPPAAQA